MKLSVVIPTITGREESVARTIASYDDTLRTIGEPGYELIVIQDAPSWPGACNMGYQKATGDVIHFTADDLEALPGWYPDAIKLIKEQDELPAPKVFNHWSGGEWDNHADGGDGMPTHFTRIPIMSRDQYERIGPWPEQLDYCADVWVSERARVVGIETRMVHSYAFVHHWEQIGRIDTPEVLFRSEHRLNQLRAGGLTRCE